MTEQSYEQIRRRMLVIAHVNEGHYQDRFLPAVRFAEARDDENQPETLTDEQTLTQLDWLVANGLLERRSNPNLGGSKPSFRHQAFRLTTKAFKLWLEEIPPIPGVADQRLEA